jgi:hypothetical protein
MFIEYREFNDGYSDELSMRRQNLTALKQKREQIEGLINTEQRIITLEEIKQSPMKEGSKGKRLHISHMLTEYLGVLPKGLINISNYNAYASSKNQAISAKFLNSSKKQFRKDLLTKRRSKTPKRRPLSRRKSKAKSNFRNSKS